MVIGFNFRSSRFYPWLCLGFFKISLELMAGVWMDGSLGISDLFFHFVWVVYLAELVKYFAYRALSSGENWNFFPGSALVGRLYYDGWRSVDICSVSACS